MTEQRYSDAARRLSDAIRQHITDHGPAVFGRWVAARLSDGGTDGVLYDTKGDAIAHQLHEQQCAYVQIVPGGMPARDAEAYLGVHRMLYAKGYRLADPDGSGRRDVHIPFQLGDLMLNREQRRRLARSIRKATR